MRSGSLIHNPSFLFHAAFLLVTGFGFLGTLLSRTGRSRPADTRNAMLIALAGAVCQTIIGLAGSLEGHAFGAPGLMSALYRVAGLVFVAGILLFAYVERRRAKAESTGGT